MEVQCVQKYRLLFTNRHGVIFLSLNTRMFIVFFRNFRKIIAKSENSLRHICLSSPFVCSSVRTST